LGRELRTLGYRKLSARPIVALAARRHHCRDRLTR